jgi:hypothetical protein
MTMGVYLAEFSAVRRKARKTPVVKGRGDETQPISPEDLKLLTPYLNASAPVTNTTGITPDMTVEDMSPAQFKEYSAANHFTSVVIAQGLHDMGKIHGSSQFPAIEAKIKELVLRSKDSYIPSGSRFAAAAELALYVQVFRSAMAVGSAVNTGLDAISVIGGTSSAGKQMQQSNGKNPVATARYSINDKMEQAKAQKLNEIARTLGMDAAGRKRLETDPQFRLDAWGRFQQIQKAIKAQQDKAKSTQQQANAAAYGAQAQAWGQQANQQRANEIAAQNAAAVAKTNALMTQNQQYTDWVTKMTTPPPVEYHYPSRDGSIHSGGTVPQGPFQTGPLVVPEEEPVEKTTPPSTIDINAPASGGGSFGGLSDKSNVLVLAGLGVLAYLLLKRK